MSNELTPSPPPPPLARFPAACSHLTDFLGGRAPVLRVASLAEISELKPGDLGTKLRVFLAIVLGGFGLMAALASAFFAADEREKRRIVSRLKSTRFGFQSLDGAWLWCWPQTPVEDTVGALGGPAVDVMRIVGLPFVRFRYAVPEELYYGEVSHALGRRVGISAVDLKMTNEVVDEKQRVLHRMLTSFRATTTGTRSGGRKGGAGGGAGAAAAATAAEIAAAGGSAALEHVPSRAAAGYRPGAIPQLSSANRRLLGEKLAAEVESAGAGTGNRRSPHHSGAAHVGAPVTIGAGSGAKSGARRAAAPVAPVSFPGGSQAGGDSGKGRRATEGLPAGGKAGAVGWAPELDEQGDLSAGGVAAVRVRSAGRALSPLGAGQPQSGRDSGPASTARGSSVGAKGSDSERVGRSSARESGGRAARSSTGEGGRAAGARSSTGVASRDSGGRAARHSTGSGGKDSGSKDTTGHAARSSTGGLGRSSGGGGSPAAASIPTRGSAGEVSSALATVAASVAGRGSAGELRRSSDAIGRSSDRGSAAGELHRSRGGFPIDIEDILPSARRRSSPRRSSPRRGSSPLRAAASPRDSPRGSPLARDASPAPAPRAPLSALRQRLWKSGGHVAVNALRAGAKSGAHAAAAAVPAGHASGESPSLASALGGAADGPWATVNRPPGAIRAKSAGYALPPGLRGASDKGPGTPLASTRPSEEIPSFHLGSAPGGHLHPLLLSAGAQVPQPPPPDEGGIAGSQKAIFAIQAFRRAGQGRSSTGSIAEPAAAAGTAGAVVPEAPAAAAGGAGGALGAGGSERDRAHNNQQLAALQQHQQPRRLTADSAAGETALALRPSEADAAASGGVNCEQLTSTAFVFAYLFSSDLVDAASLARHHHAASRLFELQGRLGPSPPHDLEQLTVAFLTMLSNENLRVPEENEKCSSFIRRLRCGIYAHLVFQKCCVLLRRRCFSAQKQYPTQFPCFTPLPLLPRRRRSATGCGARASGGSSSCSTPRASGTRRRAWCGRT